MSDSPTMTMTEDEFRLRLLNWRGIEDPCEMCGGSGVRLYGSTSTWRGGIGGQMVTSDVCDACWGSGDRFRHGCNLRRLRAEESKRVAEQAADLLARSAGATLNSARGEVWAIVKVLRDAADAEARARKPKHGRWFPDMARALANALERAVAAIKETS